MLASTSILLPSGTRQGPGIAFLIVVQVKGGADCKVRGSLHAVGHKSVFFSIPQEVDHGVEALHQELAHSDQHYVAISGAKRWLVRQKLTAEPKSPVVVVEFDAVLDFLAHLRGHVEGMLGMEHVLIVVVSVHHRLYDVLHAFLVERILGLQAVGGHEPHGGLGIKQISGYKHS